MIDKLVARYDFARALNLSHPIDESTFLGAARWILSQVTPETLVEHVCKLAEICDQVPRIIYCSTSDYIAAGLGRNGPDTILCVMRPFYWREFFELESSDGALDPRHIAPFQRTLLTPNEVCMRGSIILGVW